MRNNLTIDFPAVQYLPYTLEKTLCDSTKIIAICPDLNNVDRALSDQHHGQLHLKTLALDNHNSLGVWDLKKKRH